MGTARTTDWLTPIIHVEEKERVLREHRDEALAGPHSVTASLERAARRVEEDLCVLVEGRLVAGCVCFPSHWSLPEKLGLPVSAIHGRVPGYGTELESKVDSFLRRLPAGTVVARRNFTVHELADLFAPRAPSSTIGVPPREQWLRSERQTLSRLPKSDAVLFTIRTQQVRLRELDSGTRRKLGARLAAEPDQLIAYRDLTERRAALVDWLSS